MAAADPPKVLSVFELNQAARLLLEYELGGLWVEAEVSKVTYHGSGHAYFTLTDERASVDAVMWRSDVRRAQFRLERGLRIQAFGGLTVYDKTGRYQFQVRRVREAGLGDLMRALEQLKARLHAEGLFDEARKRPLPSMPARVGVVTSLSGAALADIVGTIQRRAPFVTVVVCQARVQGPGAAWEVTQSLRHLVAHGRCDVIIVGRGGGSLEDLWAFNDEGLARAIATCPVPVVSAVGHETDQSLTDLVADRRAKTPTEAGEFVVPDIGDLRARAMELRRRALVAQRVRLRQHAQALADLEGRLARAHPAARLQRAGTQVAQLSERLARAIGRRLERDRARHRRLAGQLAALSPLAVLDRGYALVRKDSRVVTDVEQLAAGESIVIELARGRLDARVERVHPSDALTPDPPRT